MDAEPDREIAALREIVAKLEARSEEERWRILCYLVDRYVCPRAGEAVLRALVLPKEG
jgi:hypothetical protein